MNSTGPLAGQLPLGVRGTLLSQRTNTPVFDAYENRPACFVRSLSRRAVIWKPCQRIHRIGHVDGDGYRLPRSIAAAARKRGADGASRCVDRAALRQSGVAARACARDRIVVRGRARVSRVRPVRTARTAASAPWPPETQKRSSSPQTSPASLVYFARFPNTAAPFLLRCLTGFHPAFFHPTIGSRGERHQLWPREPRSDIDCW